ncbi:MAG TPA: efflux RND transporter permease subunit [Planctomycetota bacterium]|nr:efflux RND transporter permease subunit [Planctomycetota bacterium]
MIRALIKFSFEHRWAVILAWVILILVGARAFLSLPIEPFPDPDDVHVQVITMYPGKAPEEVETVITRPLERAINGTPGLTRLRSISMFGLSVITTTFDDATSDYFARQQVFERISQVTLPTGVTPGMAALSDSIGEIYRYTVEGPGYNLVELKAIQDWIVIPSLLSVPGVADVNPFGGGSKEYLVYADPTRLRGYDVTLPQVFAALQNGNSNGGGSVVPRGDQEYTVRSVGLFSKPRDAENVVITQRNGTPVYVRDVARVEKGTIPRRGFVAKNERDDMVEGIVLLRKGENAKQVVERVEKKVEELNKTALPRGVALVPYYERTYIVSNTLKTVLENSLEGLALVLLILVVFMGELKCALVVVATIPLAVLFAFTVLHSMGATINLLSLGAVDFGIVVDGAVVMVEAMFVRLALDRRLEPNLKRGLESVVLELGPPIFFATLIIIVLNVPILTFQRVEGRIFAPLALTVGLSILGALLLALTLVPQLAALLLRGDESEGIVARVTQPFVHALTRGYASLLGHALQGRWVVLAVVSVLFVITARAASRLGTEFLPRLEEGNIWLTVTQPLSVSTVEAKRIERRIREIIRGPFEADPPRPAHDAPDGWDLKRNFPEVCLIVTQLGRPEDGTDPKNVNSTEMHVDLFPHETWPAVDIQDENGKVVAHRPRTKEELVEAMRRRLQVIPGVRYNFSQYIQDNVEEALSGVKGQVAIKVYGPDLDRLQELGDQVKAAMEKVEGVADLDVERLSGLPQLNVTIDRVQAARAGLNVVDIQQAIEMGVGGAVATSLVEADRKFDVALRLEKDYRNTPERIKGILVPTPDGSLVPIGEVADVKIRSGAAQINRETNSRRIAVKCGIEGRDLGSFIRDAQEKVAAEVGFEKTTGVDGTVYYRKGVYRLTWEGEFENQQRAMARLALIVPMCLMLIFGLLFWTFRSLRTATLIMATVPLALMGGVFGLWFMDIYLSVSAAIGFITLCGVAVQNGIILVSRIHTLRDHEKMELAPAIVKGCSDRLCPVLMTALTAALGFAPSVVSHGMGAEVRKPLATVVVFGILTATAFTLVVLPCLYRIFEKGPVKAPGLASH